MTPVDLCMRTRFFWYLGSFCEAIIPKIKYLFLRCEIMLRFYDIYVRFLWYYSRLVYNTYKYMYDCICEGASQDCQSICAIVDPVFLWLFILTISLSRIPWYTRTSVIHLWLCL